MRVRARGEGGVRMRVWGDGEVRSMDESDV